MAPSYQAVQVAIDEIEAEMKRSGMWQDTPLDPWRYDFRSAFGMDTMAFSQWLQFVFILRARQIIAEKGQFPRQSQVAAQAVREFDTVPEASHLVTLLSDFDALFR